MPMDLGTSALLVVPAEIIFHPLCRWPVRSYSWRSGSRSNDYIAAVRLSRAALTATSHTANLSRRTLRAARRLGYAAARHASLVSAERLLELAQVLRARHSAPQAAVRCATAALRLPGHVHNARRDEAIEWSLWIPVVFARLGDARTWVWGRFLHAVQTLLANDNVGNLLTIGSMPTTILAYLDGALASMPYQLLLSLWTRAVLKHSQTTRMLALYSLKAEQPSSRKKRRTSVGFVSSFFDGHSVGFWIHGNIIAMPREHIEISMFELPRYRQAGHSQATNVVYRRLRDRADHWIRISWPTMGAPSQLTPEGAVGTHLYGLYTMRRRLAEQRLDVLMFPEVGLCPLTYQIAFWRIAPVQVAGFGHALSTGLPTIDYFLSYALFEDDANEAQKHYSEHLIRLEGVPLLFPHRPDVKETHQGSLPEFVPPVSKEQLWSKLQIPAGKTYCLLQTIYKLAEPIMDNFLGKILALDGSGVFLLLDGPVPLAAEAVRNRLGAHRSHLGLAVHLVPFLNTADFLSMLYHCDAVLDAFPHGGWTTTVDALSIGSPVITAPSDRLAGRGTVGLYRFWQASLEADRLSSRWLDECCIASSSDDFAKKAVRLALNSTLPRRNFALEAHRVFYQRKGAAAFAEFFSGVRTPANAHLDHAKYLKNDSSFLWRVLPLTLRVANDTQVSQSFDSPLATSISAAMLTPAIFVVAYLTRLNGTANSWSIASFQRSKMSWVRQAPQHLQGTFDKIEVLNLHGPGILQRGGGYIIWATLLTVAETFWIQRFHTSSLNASWEGSRFAACQVSSKPLTVVPMQEGVRIILVTNGAREVVELSVACAVRQRWRIELGTQENNLHASVFTRLLSMSSASSFSRIPQSWNKSGVDTKFLGIQEHVREDGNSSYVFAVFNSSPPYVPQYASIEFRLEHPCEGCQNHSHVIVHASDFSESSLIVVCSVLQRIHVFLIPGTIVQTLLLPLKQAVQAIAVVTQGEAGAVGAQARALTEQKPLLSHCSWCVAVVTETLVQALQLVYHALDIPLLPISRGDPLQSTTVGIDYAKPGVIRLRHRSSINFGDYRRDGPWEWKTCNTEMLKQHGGDAASCHEVVQLLGDALTRLQERVLADLIPHFRANGSDDLIFLKPAVNATCHKWCGAREEVTHAELARMCSRRLGREGIVACSSRIDKPRLRGNARPPRWWRALSAARLERPSVIPRLGTGPITRPRYLSSLRQELVRLRQGKHREIPLARTFRVLYLVQGSRPAVLTKFYQNLVTPHSQLLFLAYHKGRHAGSLEFPRSLLGEGRNLLLLAARARERRLGFRYHYLIWMDDDLRLVRGSAREFEKFLAKWRPAVATPAEYPAHSFIPEYFHCHRSDDCAEAHATCHLDHNYIAYHAEAIENLWPLRTHLDRECWWTSQYRQTVEAALRYRNHMLIAKKVVVINYDHGYKALGNSWNVTHYFGQAVEEVRTRLPDYAHHCARRVEDTPHGYPWGTPARKGRRRYDAWSSTMLTASCESMRKPT